MKTFAKFTAFAMMLSAPLAAQPVASNEKSLTDPVLSAAWDRYYSALDGLRHRIESSEQYKAVPQQRAKAFHVLMEIQAMAYNFAVAPRMAHPRIFRNTAWQTDVYTMGGNGPDFDYRTVFLDGKQTYRLTGNMNDSRMILGNYILE